MLEILEKRGHRRHIQIITRSHNQNPNDKTTIDIKPIDKYKGSVVIFSKMLGAQNKSKIDEFFLQEQELKI